MQGQYQFQIGRTATTIALVFATALAGTGVLYSQDENKQKKSAQSPKKPMSLKERDDNEKRLRAEASANSKEGKFIGVFLSTTPRDEEAFPAAQWEERIKNYFKSKGYEAKVSTAPGIAAIGSTFQILVDKDLVSSGTLSELNRAALDKAINAQTRYLISKSAKDALKNDHK